MWHEARKQEKKIRGIMVDYKRRAQRRKDYYEKIKLDPAQFIRIYGRPMKISLDRSVSLAAEAPQSMMAWIGDSNIMIDRFDVRAHLDSIPVKPGPAPILRPDELDEERRANYERYRILVQNESAGVTEDLCLNQIHIDEQFGAIEINTTKKEKKEEKERLSEKKAAIGYVYEDSTPAKEDKSEEKMEEAEEDVESSDDEIDLDNILDIEKLTDEQIQVLNKLAENFGMEGDDYNIYLQMDQEEAEAFRLAKLLEEEKAQFSGRKSRRERRAFKEKRLAGRPISPPSYAARDSPKYEPMRESSSSRSPSPVGPSKFEFITSFGADSDEEARVQGPSLPPHLQPSSVKSASRSQKDEKSAHDPELAVALKNRSTSHSVSPGQRSRSTSSSRSQSRSHSRSRSRSGSRRGGGRRSRSCSRGRDRRQRSPSHSPGRSRSRSRRYDGRNQRSPYRRSRSRSRGRRSYSRSSSGSRSRSRSRSHSRSRRYSRSYSRSSSSRSRSRSRSHSRSDKKTDQPAIKSYRRPELDSSNGSDSDSGSEGKTDTNGSSTLSDRNKKNDLLVQGKKIGIVGLKSKRQSIQEKLKKKMELTLKKQYKADQKAQLQKLSKIEQERMDREEELRNMSIQMRKREREKRHRETEDVGPWRGAPPGRSRSHSRSRDPERFHGRDGHRGRDEEEKERKERDTKSNYQERERVRERNFRPREATHRTHGHARDTRDTAPHRSRSKNRSESESDHSPRTNWKPRLVDY